MRIFSTEGLQLLQPFFFLRVIRNVGNDFLTCKNLYKGADYYIYMACDRLTKADFG